MRNFIVLERYMSHEDSYPGGNTRGIRERWIETTLKAAYFNIDDGGNVTFFHEDGNQILGDNSSPTQHKTNSTTGKE